MEHATPTLYGSTFDRFSPLAQRAFVGAAAVAIGIGALSVTALESSRTPAPAELYRPFSDAVAAEPATELVDELTDFEFSAPSTPFATPDFGTDEPVLPNEGDADDRPVNAASSSASGGAVVYTGDDPEESAAAPAPAPAPSETPTARDGSQTPGRVETPVAGVEPTVELETDDESPIECTTGAEAVDELCELTDDDQAADPAPVAGPVEGPLG